MAKEDIEKLNYLVGFIDEFFERQPDRVNKSWAKTKALADRVCELVADQKSSLAGAHALDAQLHEIIENTGNEIEEAVTDILSQFVEMLLSQSKGMHAMAHLINVMPAASRTKGLVTASNTRWSRLNPVKELAFQRRREMPAPKFSRAEAIRRMEAEIVAAAREAGEPLTGADPKKTITDWFRKAGIK